MDTLPNDIIYEFTLRSDSMSLCILCLTNKYVYNLIYSNAFWVNKLKYEHLPLPYIGDVWNLEKYEVHFRSNNYPKTCTWINIYGEMLKARFVANRIIIINNVEKYAMFRPTTGEINIPIQGILNNDPYGLPLCLINDYTNLSYYLPNHLHIKLLDNTYIVEYKVFSEDYITKATETDEKTILLILTSICFDISVRHPNLNITDKNGYSFFKVYKNVYEFTYARRIGMMQLMEHQKMI